MKQENIKSRPITDDKGRVLNDLELITVALDNIDKYEEETGEAAPVEPQFVQFMREAKEACETNEDFMKYRKQHIAQTLPLDLIIANTEKRNKKIPEEEAI